MKRIISIILVILMLSITLFALTGCGEKNVNLDLAKVKESVTNLKSDTFDLATAGDSINNLQIPGLSEGTFVYDFDFKDYGITAENLQELGYRFVMNKDTKDFYAIFLPVEGKKEAVKQEMDAYIERLKSETTDTNIKAKLDNMKYEEYEGYLIYVVSNDNESVLNTIKDSKSYVVNQMADVSLDEIEATVGIKKEDLSELLMQVPMMIVNSNTYIVVKPAEGKKESVKKTIDNYMTNLENQWATYLPEQYELIKNRMEKEYGDYLIYIATTDNEKVYNTIISCTK